MSAKRATRLLTFVIAPYGDLGNIIELAAAACAAAAFGAFAVLYRRHAWALLVGIILYAADLVLFSVAVGFKDIVGLLFHALALGLLIGAYARISKLLTPPARTSLVEQALPADSPSVS